MKYVMRVVFATFALSAICSSHGAETISRPVSSSTNENADDVLIVVCGKSLTRRELDADVEKIVALQGGKVPVAQQDYFRRTVRNQLAQTFLEQNVLIAKAKACGHVVTDDDRKTREAELLKALAKNSKGPKSLEEYLGQYPLGSKRALEEFENGILIDKLVKAEIAKSPVKLKTKDVTRKLIDETLRNSGARVADEFKSLLPKDEATQKKP